MTLRLPTKWLIVACMMMGSFTFLTSSQQSFGFNSIQLTNENTEIMNTLQEMYEVFSKVRQSEDVQLLSTVLIDHPSYEEKLSPKEVVELKAYAEQILGPNAITLFGYLTAMQAKMTHRIQGTRLLISTQEKLGRELTPEELQDLAKQNHDRIPSIPNKNLPSVRMIKVEDYKNIAIEGDIASAIYDDGVTSRTALFVRVDGKWYVAGIF